IAPACRADGAKPPKGGDAKPPVCGEPIPEDSGVASNGMRRIKKLSCTGRMLPCAAARSAKRRPSFLGSTRGDSGGLEGDGRATYGSSTMPPLSHRIVSRVRTGRVRRRGGRGTGGRRADFG